MTTALFAMLAYLRAFLMARHRLAMEADEGVGRSPRLDPSHEKRESDVGRATDPWRAGITRLRDLRTYRVTLSATPKARSGGKQSQPVARFSEQPSRGDCRLRLLHCADPLVPHLVLLLRDSTRSSAHSAFQRY